MKKWLVIGASGFVGNAFCRWVGQEKVLGTYHSKSRPGMIHFDFSTMRLGELDLPLHDFSHAYILGAEARIDVCKKEKERTREINVHRTIQLVDDLTVAGIKVVFTSSDAVFDGKRGWYDEIVEPEPILEYGKHKLALEQYLKKIPEALVVRLSKVYGTTPGDKTILTDTIDAIRCGREVKAATDLISCPVHVEDAARAVWTLAGKGASGLYNTAGPEGMSRLEFTEKVYQAVAPQGELPKHITPCSIHDFHFADPRPENITMKIDKLVKSAGFTPRTVEASLRHYFLAEKKTAQQQ